MSDEIDTQITEAASAEEANTLDEIVDALVAGRAVRLPLQAGSFALTGDDARIVLQFYAGRRDLWARIIVRPDDEVKGPMREVWPVSPLILGGDFPVLPDQPAVRSGTF